jgi:hypothetical protein
MKVIASLPAHYIVVVFRQDLRHAESACRH